MRYQALSTESQLTHTHESKVGIRKSESQLAHRIREAIADERVAAFGRRCGIGESTLRKYMDGALPNSDNLVAIADTANVNIEWLAAGRGPKMRGDKVREVDKLSIPIEDRARLKTAIEGVEEGLALMKQVSTPQKSANLISGAYELLSQDEKYTKADVIRLIRIALSYGAPL